MQQSVPRSVCFLARRGFASHAKPHVHMPETAMLTNNGTHEFKRKGWELSAYMGMLGGPIILFLGLTNAPETDSDVLARQEVVAKRAGTEYLVRRASGGSERQRYIYKSREIGQPPMLHEE
ncbi:unnamed protein product [Hyaloperonospora brassicae]|uniref:Uncharacterized protein n=1 Tax=Hyaloperonospora brassicae TaxID=162125 RepID=A0AAV0TCA7_HYABA|nr:unnamed protein product [Hyaloperonospora brassicae]